MKPIYYQAVRASVASGARLAGGAERQPSAAFRTKKQTPILVAADRSGATISAVLSAVTAQTIKPVLAPVLGKDALLVTDGNNVYPPCAAALGVSHEALNQSKGERVRGELHIQ